MDRSWDWSCPATPECRPPGIRQPGKDPMPLAAGAWALAAPLPFLRRRAILGHRGLHERLECARVDLLPLVDVDRPSRVAFQAGIEEARGVRDPGPLGERELHDLRVRLP